MLFKILMPSNWIVQLLLQYPGEFQQYRRYSTVSTTNKKQAVEQAGSEWSLAAALDMAVGRVFPSHGAVLDFGWVDSNLPRH